MMNNIYESGAFTGTQGGSMHPGGLRLTDRAARRAGLKPGMRIADIGCGTGASVVFLKENYQLDIVGLEISDALIEIGLKNYPSLTLRQWAGVSLPFKVASLDAFLFECTLSVLDNTEQLLSQCAIALKPSGVLIISDVFSKRRFEKETGSRGLLTPEELTEALTAAGFDVIVSEDHTQALRTYAAELWEKTQTTDLNCLFGASCNISGRRLSDLSYILIIAKKTGD